MSVGARYIEPELPNELGFEYSQTFNRLKRLFRARGIPQEEAADLAQEAAVRAFLHIRRWGVTKAELDPLLNRIARNLLIDRYRRVSPSMVPLENADEITDPSQDPSEEVARRQRGRAVRSAIRELPIRHQEAITFSLDGMTPEEVGRLMGIGRNAADALLHRARRSLKARLAPVSDGMWGLLLGLRVRWDRLTRRSGIDGAFANASMNGVAPAGLTAATATMLALLSIVGSPMAVAGKAGSSVSTRAVVAPAAFSSGGGLGSAGGNGGSSGVSEQRVYQVGPVSNSWNRQEMDTRARVKNPSGDSDRPLVDYRVHSYPKEGDGFEGPGSEHLNIGWRVVCTTLPKACD